MKRDFNKWLASLGPAAPVKTLTELIAWNNAHQKAGAIKYGQSNLDISDEMDLETRSRALRGRSREGHQAGRHARHRRGDEGRAARRDAVSRRRAAPASPRRPGYPTVIVPFALVPNAPTPAFPAGFNAKPTPFGVSFTGMACSEPRLIELAYAFEQATKKRVPPPLFP